MEDFRRVIEPRVKGVWNIHNALLATESELDFFVILAFASGFIGNPGQSAYAASISFLDAFAQYRRILQLPASSIDLGLVKEVGHVAERLAQNVVLDAFVHDIITEKELHALATAAIADKNPYRDYTQTITGVSLDPTKPMPFWASDPKILEILPTFDQSIESDDGNEASVFRNALRCCTSRHKAVHIICDALASKLSAISFTPKSDFDVHKNMEAYYTLVWRALSFLNSPLYTHLYFIFF